MEAKRPNLGIKIALSITALEFFGPTLRDMGASHALNPTWVGHARVHLVWLLGFMTLSGVVNLVLIWNRHFGNLRDLVLAATWQSCNLGGFWIAYFLCSFYDGAITVPGIHTHIFGIDENVFAFTVLSIIVIGVWIALIRSSRGASKYD